MREPRHLETPDGRAAGAAHGCYLFSGSPLRAVHVDRGAIELWGATPEAIARDPELLLARVHAQDRQRLLDAWRSPHSERWDVVYRVLRPDGDTRWVRDQGFALVVGTPPGRQVSGRVEDVTAQRQLEEQMCLHCQLLDAVGQAVIAADLDGRITHWSRGAERMFGWSAPEAMGRTVTELFGGTGSQAQLADAVRQNLAGGLESTGEHVVRTKQGREVLVETRTSALVDADGGLVGRVVVSADVSRRKEAERRLRESEERFRALFEEARIGSAIVDLDGKVSLANEALATFLRCEVKDLIGEPVRTLSQPSQEDEEERELRRMLLGEVDRYVIEKRYRRRDGELVWGRLTATMVRDEQRVPLYTICMVEDVDDRRRATAELRASREEMQRLYAHLQVVRELEQTRIARDLHDELGQMLTALKLDVASLRRRAGRAPLSREDVLQRLAQTTSLVDQALEATRRLAMQLRPVVLDDLGLEAAIEWLVEEVARRAGLRWKLHLEIDDLEPSPLRDTAAYRVLQEALTNVARHARAKMVAVRVTHRNGVLLLSVRDDGRGIPPGAGRATASMGLAGMRERARGLGGELRIRRPRSGGTLVHVRLPDPAPQAPQPEQGAEEP